MARSVQQATQILHRLSERLVWQAREWEVHDRYYRGEHKLKYASAEFSNYFAHRYKGFADNWTQVIADAPTERLEVIGIRPAAGYGSRKKGGDDQLWRDWVTTECDHFSDLAWLDAIIARRSFTLVWGDADANPLVTWESPAQAIVDYDPDTRQRRYGAKIWRDEAKEFGTLYDPEAVYKFERNSVIVNEGRTPGGLYLPAVLTGFGGWTPRQVDGEPWPLPNPLGVVPLVEHQNRSRLLGPPMSDVSGAIAMQDAINLLWAYLFNAADYASFPQRAVLNAERPVVPVLNSDGEVVGEEPVDLEKFAVDRVIWIEGKEAKIAEWSPANLAAYTEVMETAITHLAAQTRTPAHYMLLKSGPSNISGDALKGLETGLAMRAREKTQHFGRSVREVFRLMALVRGDDKKAAATAAGTVLWRDVETRSEAQLADSLLKYRQMGFPFEWICEQFGLSPTEVTRIMAMRQDELASDPLGMLAPGSESTAGADGGGAPVGAPA